MMLFAPLTGFHAVWFTFNIQSLWYVNIYPDEKKGYP
jgi:hypothetical protein